MTKKATTAAQAVEKSTLDLRAAAEACFEANPEADQFHQTSDGQCFADEAFAKRHAKTLEDDAVSLVTRDGETAAENTEDDNA